MLISRKLWVAVEVRSSDKRVTQDSITAKVNNAAHLTAERVVTRVNEVTFITTTTPMRRTWGFDLAKAMDLELSSRSERDGRKGQDLIRWTWISNMVMRMIGSITISEE
jgi:hypothetical protein